MREGGDFAPSQKVFNAFKELPTSGILYIFSIMSKNLAIFVFSLCLLLVAAYSQIDDARPKDDSAQPSDQTPATNTDKRDSKTLKDDGKKSVATDVKVISSPPKDRWDKAAVILNICLVAVGVFGIVVAICTLLFIKAQVVEMRRQRVAMQKTLRAINRQANLMEQQNKAMRDKERAIIQVEVMYIPASPPGNLPLPPYDIVSYNVFNRGLTAAKIAYAYAVVDISETDQSCSGENSTFSNADFGMNLGSLFSPASDGVTRYAVSEVSFDWDDINKRKNFVHFHGKVEYRDLFSEDGHETAFHYVWWIDSQPLPSGSIFGRWVERGGKKENYQT